MSIQHWLGNTRGPRDLLGRRVLVTQRDEEVFGVGEQLPLAVSLAHARSGPGSLITVSLGGGHRHLFHPTETTDSRARILVAVRLSSQRIRHLLAARCATTTRISSYDTFSPSAKKIGLRRSVPT